MSCFKVRGSAIPLLAVTMMAAACAPKEGGVDSSASVSATGVKTDTPAAGSMYAESGVDGKALAARLVGPVSGVKQGDIVVIEGAANDFALLEDIAIEVEKAGGSPIVTARSDRFARREYDEVPARFDSLRPRAAELLVTNADVLINIESPVPKGLMSGVDPARVAVRSAQYQAMSAALYRGSVRTVLVGNGMLPSDLNADLWGMSKADIAKMYWPAVGTSDDTLRALGERLRVVLASGKLLHITNPNGTDITLSIAGMKTRINAGVIPESARKGGGAVVYLPAGELYMPIAAGSANGVLATKSALDPDGAVATGIKATVKDGRVTAFVGESGFESLQKAYAASGAGKDIVSAIDFGLNPNVPAAADSRMRTWVGSGMLTIGMGGNVWAGGTNPASFEFGFQFPGSTVELDGRVIMKDGKFVF